MIHLRTQSGIISENKYITNPAFSRKEAVKTVNFTPDFLEKELSKKLKRIGDDNFYNKQDNKAILYYQEAIKTNPNYSSPYYNLAKIYKKQNKTDQAITFYKQLLDIKPQEIEAQTLIGNCFKLKGNYETAKEAYKKAVKINPKYDFAKRSLEEIDNLILAQINPITAKEIKSQVAQNNLNISLTLVNQHALASLTKNLQDIDIVFGETDSLSGVKNIAQYENHNGRIVITNDYIWAAPEIVAAYIIHEAIHARDNDGLSSIKEEQDAYQASIEFWIAYNNEIKDPELDYAAALYRKNPQKLAQKVAETYKNRDESIPEYSPNHMPPSGQGLLSKMKLYFSRAPAKR